MIAAAMLFFFAQSTGTIAGAVTDSITHRPVRSALVTVVNGSRDVTADDGSYTVRYSGAGEVRLRVVVAGYREFQTSIRPESDFFRHDVELHPLARISGKVLDKDTGEPIVRAVSVQRKGGGDLFHQHFPPGKDGSFEIPDLEPGDYVLGLRESDEIALGFGAGNAEKSRRFYGAAASPGIVHVEEGDRPYVEMRLPRVPARSVTGEVDAPADHRGKDYSLTLWHTGAVPPLAGVARGRGTFRIDGLIEGEYTLVAEIGKGTEIFFGHSSFNITDHDIEDAKISLSPSAELSGTIRMAEEDAPLPANLAVWLDSSVLWGSCAAFCMTLRSTALVPLGLQQTPGLVALFHSSIPVHNGRFHAEGIAPGDYWPLLFGAEFSEMRDLPDGYAILSGDEQPAAIYGSTELNLVLTSRAGAIAGTVQDENQLPVAKALVLLSPASDPRRGRVTQSGAAGQFTFRNLAPGKYRVNGTLVEVGFGQTVTLTAPPGASQR